MIMRNIFTRIRRTW